MSESPENAEVDTIAALATGPGTGAIAVIRCSGRDAFSILRRLTGAEQPAPRLATLRTITDPLTDERIDQVLITCFPGPDSYTGEDVVEISGHGGTLGPALILNAIMESGARAAGPGEFTRRAWLNGKLDLVQAEAISDLIEGRSRVAHRTAMHQLDRGLSTRVDALRKELIGVEAWLAHHIDFPEEDDAPTPLHQVSERARRLANELERLANTASEGVLLRRGALVVLAGPPNAGKSSLLNALVGEERALVTDVAGTTRDAIEVEVSLGGFPFRLVDTAGLRDTAEQIERLGIEVAERYLGSADLVLLCTAPESDPPLVEQAEEVLARSSDAPIVRVVTKADEAGPVERKQEEVWVSAHRGDGLSELRALLPRLVFQGLVESSEDVPVLTRERQARAARTAAEEVRSFCEVVEVGVPAEVASAHLKSAATALEELLGIVTEDDVLDAVFRSFCVGK